MIESQSLADLFRCRVEFCATGFLEIRGAKSKTKSISRIAWNDMQMHVENFLHRCLPIGQEEIYAFAPDPAAAQGASQALSYPKHVRAGLFFQIGQKSGVVIRHDEHVAGIDGLGVQEGGAVFILIDLA
jgi:hypothetical protein